VYNQQEQQKLAGKQGELALNNRAVTPVSHPCSHARVGPVTGMLSDASQFAEGSTEFLGMENIVEELRMWASELWAAAARDVRTK
jgi:hypothetical protein